MLLTGCAVGDSVGYVAGRVMSSEGLPIEGAHVQMGTASDISDRSGLFCVEDLVSKDFDISVTIEGQSVSANEISVGTYFAEVYFPSKKSNDKPRVELAEFNDEELLCYGLLEKLTEKTKN